MVGILSHVLDVGIGGVRVVGFIEVMKMSQVCIMQIEVYLEGTVEADLWIEAIMVITFVLSRNGYSFDVVRAGCIDLLS